jgi:hypothetical protein
MVLDAAQLSPRQRMIALSRRDVNPLNLSHYTCGLFRLD